MLVLGVMANVPASALVPVHPPLAVQEVEFLLDQLKIEEPPAVTVAGSASRVTVGAGVGDGCAATTVIDVAWQEAAAPAASNAQTLKPYWPAVLLLPVRSPFGLMIMPSGGVPDARVPES